MHVSLMISTYTLNNDSYKTGNILLVKTSIIIQTDLPTTTDISTTPALHDQSDSATTEQFLAISTVLGILLFIIIGAIVLFIVYCIYLKRYKCYEVLIAHT